MNGLPQNTPAGEAAEGSGPAVATGHNETAPLLPHAGEKEGFARRCVGMREMCIAGILVVGLVVFGVLYFERRPRRLETSHLQRISVDVGLHSPRLTQVAAKEITDKPRNDKRRYQHVTLPNGLQVLNVQDSQSLKTSFAMAVKAGSYDDPVELPGLAHFCEHMLFLGTKKFPEPSGFDDFMAKSGGQDNAYTASEVTVYFGEVSKLSGQEGLDRFSDFFREPLFDKRFVKKEVHAIDSEHAKNVQSPSFRIMEALNSLSDPKSPIGRFHTGNFDTLYDLPHKEGRDPVDALKVYFSDHYCPKQMRLVTFGPDPLVVQLNTSAKLFGPIERGNAQCNRPRTGFASPAAFPTNRLGKWLVAEGTQPQPQLWVHFPLPDVSKEYKSQPLEYIDYVFGYGGENSLARVLQDTLGLASGSQVMFDMASSGTNLYYLVTLTPRGKDHPEAVLDVLYSYIANLHNNGVDEALYDTIVDVMKLKWDWAEPSGPSDTASDLAERMTRLPLDRLLSGDTRIDQPDHQLVESLLNRLTPDNMNVAFVTPNFTKSSLAKAETQSLPYYDVEYAVENTSTVLPGAAQRWSSWLSTKATDETLKAGLTERLRAAQLIAADEFAPFPQPPRPIDGVPKDINLDHMHAKSSDGSSGAGVDEALFGPRPSTMALSTNLQEQKTTALRGQRQSNDSDLAPEPSDSTAPEVWYRSGWVTNSPKVTIQLDMRMVKAPEEDTPAIDSVRLGIYSRLLAAEIAPKMADLTATGVSYDIAVSTQGISFSFGGFAPVLPKLVDTVLAEFNRFNQNSSITEPARFKRITEELREELSTYTEMPVQYAVGERSLLLTRHRHSNQESLQALSAVSLQSAATSANELVLSRPLQLTSLAMGNIAEDEARHAVEKVWGGLDRHLSAAAVKLAAGGEVERVSPVVNPAQPIEVRMKNPRPGDPNDATVVSLIWGPGTVETRVTLGLVGQILGNVAYTELRTSRQLGYVVSAGSAMASNVQYMSTVVQGNVEKADNVEAAIEVVLSEMMPKRLQELTQDEFDSYVDSFRQELLQPPLSPSEEVSQFWGPVRQGGHCFELRGEILKYLNSSSLTRQSLRDVWQKLVTPAQGVRKKIVVKYFADSVPEARTPEEAYKLWREQGLSEASAKRMLAEKKQALVLDRADSAARKRIVEGGGYFPKDLSCRYDPQQAASNMLLEPALGAPAQAAAAAPQGVAASFLQTTARFLQRASR